MFWEVKRVSTHAWTVRNSDVYGKGKQTKEQKDKEGSSCALAVNKIVNINTHTHKIKTIK